jgi:N-acetylglucosaminyldiphosphoundecaprenol N-acetyl-beta-D-mannosaminyltransferase
VAINPEKVVAARRDSQLGRILAEANPGICDGIGIVAAAMLLDGLVLKRITGVQLCAALLRRAAEMGWGVFLLGASAASNDAASRTLKQWCPPVRVVGRQHGFFEDSDAVVEAINQARPDLLIVGLGSPRQEHWIARHRVRLDATLCMGVGGAIDIIAGNAVRAPRICQATGTEFAYRLLREPSRWRRQARLLIFLFEVMRAKCDRIVCRGSDLSSRKVPRR